ncbi:histidine kinase [Metabacillus sp. BG109]|uniref:Histidine kinase n=1 Tax=Metabacillus bambusae TaxID=2795218 RepID=A0ABS3N5K6_9BACI|nr:histidine kinase [Metabacillus bambusae]
MNIFHGIKGSPIKKKIILLALFSTLIPLLVVGPITFAFLNKSVENKVSTTVTNLLTIANWNINTFVADIEDISNIVFLSNDIHRYLTHNKKDPKHYMYETSSRNTLSNITVVNKPYIHSIYIGNENHGFLKVNQGDSNMNGNVFSQIEDTTLYHQLLESPWKGQWFNSSKLRLNAGNDQPFLFGRMIRNLGSKAPIGVLLISIDPMIFENMFKEVNIQGNIIVLNREKILYSRNKLEMSPIQLTAIIDGSKENGTVINYIDGRKNIINYHTNENTDWKIVSIVPFENVVQDINQIRLITITLLVIAFIISVVFAIYLSSRITRELGLLRLVTEQMERREIVSGIHFNKEDEIGKIGNRFVELYNRNNELTLRLYKAKVKEKEAELLALQSHINPHFLYNTLNAMF